MQKLYKHQQELLDLTPNKYLLCWGTGTGKSLAAIALANQKRKKTLVICPKALKEKWRRDMEENCKVSEWEIYSKEEFRKLWPFINCFDTIIIDEAHYYSNYKSQMTKSLLNYIKKWNLQNIYLLTATPFLSSAWNIYTLSWILGKKLNYPKFKWTFFNEIRMGRRIVPVAKAGMEKELAKITNSLGSPVRLEDCADVPEQVFEEEIFALTKEQEEAIREVKLNEVNHIVKWTKIHEIEQGILKGDGYTKDKTFTSDKVDRIVELCAGNPKIAIVCRYNLQIDYLKNRLESEGIGPVLVIRGDIKNRDEVVFAVEKLSECVILIQASCSEGYELPSVGVIVFASMSFAFKDYLQMQGRFLRINALKKNVFIHLLVDGVDKDVYKSIQAKADFHFETYARE